MENKIRYLLENADEKEIHIFNELPENISRIDLWHTEFPEYGSSTIEKIKCKIETISPGVKIRNINTPAGKLNIEACNDIFAINEVFTIKSKEFLGIYVVDKPICTFYDFAKFLHECDYENSQFTLYSRRFGDDSEWLINYFTPTIGDFAGYKILDFVGTVQPNIFWRHPVNTIKFYEGKGEEE